MLQCVLPHVFNLSFQTSVSKQHLETIENCMCQILARHPILDRAMRSHLRFSHHYPLNKLKNDMTHLSGLFFFLVSPSHSCVQINRRLTTFSTLSKHIIQLLHLWSVKCCCVLYLTQSLLFLNGKPGNAAEQQQQEKLLFSLVSKSNFSVPAFNTSPF